MFDIWEQGYIQEQTEDIEAIVRQIVISKGKVMPAKELTRALESYGIDIRTLGKGELDLIDSIFDVQE